MFLTSAEARSLQIKAGLAGKKLDIQHGYDGTLWCYKHEYYVIGDIKRKVITSINNSKTMDVKNKKDMYYDRAMNSDLKGIIEKEYKWLIDEVIKNPELDFQTGSNDKDSWFSVYRGTGRILTIKPEGVPNKFKLFADSKYMKLVPSFYNKPDIKGLQLLMSKIREDSTLGRYYIGTDGKRKEGYYQNLISRRYSLFCEPEDDYIIIDKEFVLGYSKDEIKKTIMEPIQKKYADIIKSLSEKFDYCKNIKKQPGTECDFVGLSRQGDILLLELKRHEDTTKIYLSPLQAGKYDDLTKEYFRRYPEDFNVNIINMARQKKEMGILKPQWDIPAKISGRIIPAVVVGGNPSKKAVDRFIDVRKAVEKDISLFTCDEKGTLIKLI